MSLFGRNKVISILLLSVATCLTYANSLSNSFHYDDFHGIVRNPIIKDLRNVVFYFTDPSTFSLSHYNDWRPILQITYALNYLIGGLEPAYFRIFNLLIHLASAVLVYLISEETSHSLQSNSAKDFRVPTFFSALATALIFVLHPANSEVVNYIWPRSTLLASFFYLFGFYCYLRAHRGSDPFPNRSWYAGLFCCYVLGLGTKATTITLPGMLLLYDFLRSQSRMDNQPGFRRWAATETKRLLPLIVVGALYATLRVTFLPESFTRVVDSQEVSRITYFLSSIRALVYYLGLYIWPFPLLVNFHGFGWSDSLSDLRVLQALGTILFVLGVAWRIRRSEFIVSFFTFWFFIALLPEQSFFPLSEPVNGYRPYLAYAGLSIVFFHALQAGLVGLSRFPKRRQANFEPPASWCLAFGLGLIVLIVTLTTWCIQRNRDWRDERTLWSDVLQNDPNNPRAHMVLGFDLIEHGDYSKAEAMFEKAIQLAPKNSYAYLSRAYLHNAFNRGEMALQDLTMAVQLNRRSTFAHFYRGELLAQEGNYSEAIKDYERALMLKHYFTDARFGLAMAYLHQLNLEKGRENCERILVIDRRDARAYRCLGRIFMEQKNFVAAARVLRKGITYLPNEKELWYDLALTQSALGVFDQAALAFRKASELGLTSPK